jgi:orotate phosphoribosyltransferase
MTTSSMIDVVDHGGVYELVADPRLVLSRLSAGTNIVGLGPAGVVVGAAAAAAAGRDFAFCRHEAKDHGLGRQVEGRWDPARECTIVSEREDAARVATAAGLRVADVVPVRRGNGTAAPWRFDALRFVAPATDPGDHVELVTGRTYVRSSGERAPYYFETLGAAHRYDVAASHADVAIADGLRADLVAGIMWGGCYLAAVLAARSGSRLMIIDPDAARPEVRLREPAARITIVDDLVNSGTDMRLCERIAAHNNSRATFCALYSVHSAVSLERHDVRIACRLVAPAGTGAEPVAGR